MKNRGFSPSRRTVLKGTAWSVPAVMATAAVPSYAASPLPVPEFADLAIEVSDPPFDWETFDIDYSTPIYNGVSGTRAIGQGSLPETLTITNLGPVPATSPSGSFSLQMRDVGSDAVSAGGANRTRATTTDASFLVEDTNTRDSNGGGVFTWVYNGTLSPGESVELPLKYYVNYPFANADYELLVTATVTDSVDGDSNDTDVKMGTVKGFARYF